MVHSNNEGYGRRRPRWRGGHAGTPILRLFDSMRGGRSSRCAGTLIIRIRNSFMHCLC